MNLRQQMRQGTKRPPRTGGGGGGGGALYRDQYYPPKDSTHDIVRIIPGAYAMPQIDYENKDYFRNPDNSIVTVTYPYYKYNSYYFAPRKQTIIGSEGPLGGFKGKGEPSLVSDWYWWEWAERNRTGDKEHPNTLRRSDMCAVSVLVQAPFYKVPQTDKDGKVRMDEKKKQPYMMWAKGSTRGNDQYALGGYERKDGHVMHWSLGYNQWNTLTEYANSLATSCRSCHGQDTIRELALVCRACGEPVVEIDTTTLSDAELNKIRDEQVKCHHCQVSGFLDNVIQCTNCAHAEEATLFDFDLEVTQVKASDGGKGFNLVIRKAIGPRDISPMYKDDERKSLDLTKIFAPFSMEQQLKILGPLPVKEEDNGEQTRQPVNNGTRGY